ncbi:General transcription factor 3c polypeptide [Thalictrum thalictroides]|uniref:General transcription factor 3c polypeptide n=1 Tax=Thalictrum thalictroides TaxID=46969 RepID=A0A7J6VUI4_THATH|nr:General transcription factor 3c polypeptide [Thalictrum thalictroides]
MCFSIFSYSSDRQQEWLAMGVIKDGTVSGILPENVGFAVHYPGYPSSTSRAVETLGGSEVILKTRSASSEPLELRFRPEDPYSHPAFGYLRPCSNFLLKISKQQANGNQDAVISKIIPECSLTNKESSESRNCFPENVNNQHESTAPDNALDAVKKDNQPQMEEAAELVELSADIVARVSEAYHFNGMVDYQHVVAVHAHAGKNKNKKRDRAEEELYSEKGGPMDIDQEDVMILVPPLFSPKDVPEKIVLKPSATINSKRKLEAIVKQRWEMQIEPCLAIDFNIEDILPLVYTESTRLSEIPRKVNWEDHITRGSDHWDLQMAVSTLFDERPIWPTLSLNHHLLDKGVTLGGHLLKRLLFRTAYYFSTGPYRRLWIRKGYDPRKDPESRVYQRIDFRIPPPLRYIDESSTDKLKHMWKDLCTFHVFPCKSQISLQLFELVDDYIQEEIRKPPEETFSVRSFSRASTHI